MAARLLSRLMTRFSPDELAFVLLDLANGQLARYDGLPHNYGRVVQDVPEAVGALQWLVDELEARSRVIARHGFRNLPDYNEVAPEGRVPHCICVVHDVAPVLATSHGDTVGAIRRLLVDGQDAGIHLVLVTGDPPSDALTR